MSRTALSLSFLAAVVAVALAVPSRVPADEEGGVSSGKVKSVSLPLTGAAAGRVYFEIDPVDAGAPSAFNVEAGNWAAVQILCTARAAGVPVKVTYKSDFSVTELDF